MTRREYGFTALACLISVFLLNFILHKKKKTDFVLYLTTFTAVFLRGFYIWYTPTWIRQHDVIGFNNGKGIGQAAFIEWFYQKGILPDFDVRERWGFFQPALHHIVSALWLKLNIALGFGYSVACENIQILTAAYSILISYFAYRIFYLSGLRGKPLKTAFAIAALHPSYILLSGSVNNDCLCILLTVMSIYFALNWERKSSLANILLTGLCIGLAMMTKLSGVLVAPAVAYLFIDKWIRGGREKFFYYLKQYLCFGAVAFPLGLFFPIRNYLKFGVPLNYTPPVGEPLARTDLFSRLLDIRTATPFTCLIKNGDAYDEFNIPLAIMKTSLTGEDNLALNNPYIMIPSWLLFAAGTALAVIALIATIYIVFGGSKFMALQSRVFWGILYVTAVAFILNLCFSIPNFSSQDFRYVSFLLVPECLALGCLMQYKKRLLVPIEIISAVFAASTAAVYILIGLP